MGKSADGTGRLKILEKFWKNCRWRARKSWRIQSLSSRRKPEVKFSVAVEKIRYLLLSSRTWWPGSKIGGECW